MCCWLLAMAVSCRPSVDALAQRARSKVIWRNPPVERPLHDNGLVCLAGLLDVAPQDVTSGSHDAWAKALLECGSSAKLALVDGLLPWETQTRRWATWQRVFPWLLRTMAQEIETLNRDGQAHLAAARCTGMLELSVDQSHLGSRGATWTAQALTTLTPPCRNALLWLSAEAQAALKREWSVLAARLPTPEEEELVAQLEKQPLSTLTAAHQSSLQSLLALSQ